MDLFLAASVFDYTPEEKASASKNKVAKNKEEKKNKNQKKKGSIFDDPTDPTPMKDKKLRPSLRRECPIGVWVPKLRETPKGPPHTASHGRISISFITISAMIAMSSCCLYRSSCLSSIRGARGSLLLLCSRAPQTFSSILPNMSDPLAVILQPGDGDGAVDPLSQILVPDPLSAVVASRKRKALPEPLEPRAEAYRSGDECLGSAKDEKKKSKKAAAAEVAMQALDNRVAVAVAFTTSRFAPASNQSSSILLRSLMPQLNSIVTPYDSNSDISKLLGSRSMDRFRGMVASAVLDVQADAVDAIRRWDSKHPFIELCLAARVPEPKEFKPSEAFAIIDWMWDETHQCISDDPSHWALIRIIIIIITTTPITITITITITTTIITITISITIPHHHHHPITQVMKS